MRQITFILILSFTIGFFEIKAQNTDTTNVYYQALKFHLDYLNTINKMKPIEASLIYNFNVERDIYTTDSLPNKINDLTIDFLTQEEIFKRTKNKNLIHLITIRPAFWKNGRLVINVIDFKVSRKNRHLYYSNLGGSSFQVIGDNESSRLKLKIIHQGGI